MTVKVILAEILRNELTARGVNSLAPTDYEQIVERLIERLPRGSKWMGGRVALRTDCRTGLNLFGNPVSH